QLRAIPVPGATHDPGHGQLPRCLGVGGRAVRGHADRAGGERRRPDDLHEVVEHQRRPHAARRELRGRRRPGHRQRADPEPGLLPSDVISAVKDQNLQAPAGRIGQAPTPADQAFTFTVSAPGHLVTTDEFENIIIRESSTGSVVRIRDVGRAELGSQDYNSFGRLNGKPSGAMAVYLLPGANQLKASEAIYKTMATAKNLFPPGLDYKIVYDTTPAVEAS